MLESLAFNVMSRIEDVIQADNVAREKAKRDAPAEGAGRRDPQSGGEDDDRSGTTLLDFMGWTGGDSEGRNDDCSPPPPPEQDDGRLMKLPNIMTNLKQTYMDKLDFLSGNRSPSGRH